MRALAGEFPMTALCKTLEVPRSSGYYKRAVRPVKDLSPLKCVIEVLLGTHRGFGVKRMYYLLARKGVLASRAEVRQAYFELGRLKKHARKGPKTTNSRHEFSRYDNLVDGLSIEHPDQVWAADVTYVKIWNRFAYLALVMDIYTRCIVGWALGVHNDAVLTVSALQLAFSSERSPEIHHSDQGSTYACPDYVKLLNARGILISMAAVGEPKQNGYVERLNRTVKEEEVYISHYEDFEDAFNSIRSFIDRYNNDRIHSSLRYQTPSEVFAAWMREHGN